jgi:hypothetical protein
MGFENKIIGKYKFMKTKIFLVSLSFILLFCLFIFAEKSLAEGSADVSWIAPTEDAGGGALTGLAGYKVFHDTASHWATGCPKDVGTIVDVPGGGVTSYFIQNTLEPGQTHYFAVVAYDEAGNMSDCATTESLTTEYSKVVTYSGDLDGDHDVDLNDLTNLTYDFGKSDFCAPQHKEDVIRNCEVDLNDLTALTHDFDKKF